MRAPLTTMPASVSFTILAARSLSCCSTGRERSTCGLTSVCVITMSFSRAIQVVVPEIVGVAAERLMRRGEAGQRDVHEVGAAAEHAAGRIHPGLHHLAPADQVIDRRGWMNDRPTRSPLEGERIGHPLQQRRIVLHVVEFGHAVRRRGEAAIGDDIGDKFAVDPDLSIVAQRIEEGAAGADGHGAAPISSLPPYASFRRQAGFPQRSSTCPLLLMAGTPA